MTEEKDNKMDFLEDLDMYNRAMENAYSIITKKKTKITNLNIQSVSAIHFFKIF